jgi:hypothetical protein
MRLAAREDLDLPCTRDGFADGGIALFPPSESCSKIAVTNSAHLPVNAKKPITPHTPSGSLIIWSICTSNPLFIWVSCLEEFAFQIGHAWKSWTNSLLAAADVSH